MTTVKLTPEEERAWWWPLVGLACCAASALLVLTPAVLWFIDLTPERQRELIETVVGGGLALVGVWAVVEATALAEKWWRL